MKTDQYTHPDYYDLDELYSDEHKLVRDAELFLLSFCFSPFSKRCLSPPRAPTSAPTTGNKK